MFIYGRFWDGKKPDNLCTSLQKGRLGGAACLPVLVGFSKLGVVKEDAEVSVLYSFCSGTCKGDCSFEEAGAILGGATVKGADVGMVLACVGAEGRTVI